MTNDAYTYRNNGDYFWWAKAPGFHPLKLVSVLVGFAIFPPLGVAAIIYFLWMGRRAWGGPDRGFRGGRGCGGRGRGRSGNHAFDEHQAKILSELENERRAFREHRDEQRRQRDVQAYEAFRAAQTSGDAKPADGAQ
jgi:Protein of unknown function (DUF2852)